MLLKNSSFIPASTQTLSPEGTDAVVDDGVGVGVEVGVGVGVEVGVVELTDTVVPSGVEVSGLGVLLVVAVSNGLAL